VVVLGVLFDDVDTRISLGDRLLLSPGPGEFVQTRTVQRR